VVQGIYKKEGRNREEKPPRKSEANSRLFHLQEYESAGARFLPFTKPMKDATKCPKKSLFAFFVDALTTTMISGMKKGRNSVGAKSILPMA
jgi:hypothetical protein